MIFIRIHPYQNHNDFLLRNNFTLLSGDLKYFKTTLKKNKKKGLRAGGLRCTKPVELLASPN